MSIFENLYQVKSLLICDNIEIFQIYALFYTLNQTISYSMKTLKMSLSDKKTLLTVHIYKTNFKVGTCVPFNYLVFFLQKQMLYF